MTKILANNQTFDCGNNFSWNIPRNSYVPLIVRLFHFINKNNFWWNKHSGNQFERTYLALIVKCSKNIPKVFNDTHREKLWLTQLRARMDAWLLLTFFKWLNNKLSSIHSITSIKTSDYSTVSINEFQQVLPQNLSWFLS